MRYVFAEPTRHPTAWLMLLAGLVCLGFFLLMRETTGMVGVLVGVSFTALGLAELLPLGQRALTVGLRVVGLLLAAATIVVAVWAMIF